MASFTKITELKRARRRAKLLKARQNRISAERTAADRALAAVLKEVGQGKRAG